MNADLSDAGWISYRQCELVASISNVPPDSVSNWSEVAAPIEDLAKVLFSSQIVRIHENLLNVKMLSPVHSLQEEISLWP